MDASLRADSHVRPRGAQTEVSLAVAAYNLKRMRNILGGDRLTSMLRTA